MSIFRRFAPLVVAALVAAPAAAMADTYTSANFSGAFNSGGANVKAPFSGAGFTQGQSFSGSFVYDNNLVPAGPGVTNIFYQNFPDTLPDASAFSLSFGTLNFTLADHVDSLIAPSIQYKNGQFNGFIFIADFLFQNSWYQLNMNGPTATVKLLDGIPNQYDPHGYTTGGNLINAHLNIGDTNLSGQTPFTPGGGAVPEPSTWAMMIVGFLGVGFMLRRSRRSGQTLATA